MNWPRLPFDEVFDDVSSRGIRIPTDDYHSHGQYPIVDQGKKTIAGYTDEGRCLVQSGLPVILFGDHTKALKYINFPFCIGADGVKLLKPKTTTQADTKYLYHYLKTLKLHDAGYSRHFKFLKRIEVPLPPLDEQKRIAAILDKAEELRAKRAATNNKINQLLDSVLYDMFGDISTNHKGWKVVQLKDVCTRVTDGTHQSPEWSNDGVPFLFISNIVEGKINFDTKKFVSLETHRELTRNCPIEQDDILYTTVGSYGNAALVDTAKSFVFQRHIAHIKPDRKLIHPEFLLGMMQSSGIRRQADEGARGIAQKTLNLAELKKFRIFNVPVEQQFEYVQIRRSILQHQLRLQKSEETVFQALGSIDELRV